jgi:hypothetical protein
VMHSVCVSVKVAMSPHPREPAMGHAVLYSLEILLECQLE